MPSSSNDSIREEAPAHDGRREPILDRRRFDALVFDLDGVLTSTATLHAAAWKRLFDGYLERRARERRERFEPFTAEDYRRYVDGRPRYEGVEAFLASRRVEMPRGEPSDPPDRDTVCGLGNRKNAYFHEALAEAGVEVFERTVEFVRRARSRGFAVGIASGSKNAAAVLEKAGLSGLVEVRVDGAEAERLGLREKRDLFLEAARRLRAEARRTVLFEDSLAGVRAGRAGGFGLVVGVDRGGHADELARAGAEVVVGDPADLSLGGSTAGRPGDVPSALERSREIEERAAGKRLAVFLDYDGTLTPIVERPELAVLSPEMRAAVRELAERSTVAVVSGRDRADVERLVGVDTIVYAGSHGFDIAGPGAFRMEPKEAVACLPALRAAESALHERIDGIPGALVESKRFAIAVHFRRVAERDVPRVEEAVDEVLRRHARLRKTGGKKIFELRPAIEWHKGKAVLWLLDALGLDPARVLPLYLGDDETDEDAFEALEGLGIGILVADRNRPTRARYRLRDVTEVGEFLATLARASVQ